MDYCTLKSLAPRISTNRAADYIRPSSPACRLTDHLTQQHPRPRRRCAVSFPPHPSSGSVFCLSPHSSSLLFHFFFLLASGLSSQRFHAHTPSHSFFFVPLLLFWSCRLLLPRLGRPTLSACAGPTTLHWRQQQGLSKTLARSPASTSTSQPRARTGQDRTDQDRHRTHRLHCCCTACLYVDGPSSCSSPAIRIGARVCSKPLSERKKKQCQ
ncbi:hypothetical protein GGI42DRAFT_244551 [Trichoderma sp. SZMC 28013]